MIKMNLEDRTQLEIMAVRNRLEKWRAYHEFKEPSQPGNPYTPSDKVADAVYYVRKLFSDLSVTKTQSALKLNLNVTDDAILRALERSRKGEKFIFLD